MTKADKKVELKNKQTKTCFVVSSPNEKVYSELTKQGSNYYTWKRTPVMIYATKEVANDLSDLQPVERPVPT